MTQDQVLVRAQELIGYEFQDLDLLRQALTHASIADTRLESNERLEFLGDSVLALVVCSQLFDRFPDYLEGELTKLKSVIVSRKTCAHVADQLGLTPLLFVGKGMNSHEPVPTSLRAAVLESVIAAIYIDGGFDAARDFILQHLSYIIDETDSLDHHQNYKSALQQHAQKHMFATPQYVQLDEQGPDHSKCFEVCVTIGNRRFPAAWGPSKKEAEQGAALNALRELSYELNDQPDSSTAEPSADADDPVETGSDI